MISAKVKLATLDQKTNNILVATEYTLTDGSKVTGHTRYSYHNYSREKVLADIQQHCETLVANIYRVSQLERINKPRRNLDLITETKIDDLTASSNSVELECDEIKDVRGEVLQTAKRIKVTIDAEGNITEEVLREGKQPIGEIPIQ